MPLSTFLHLLLKTKKGNTDRNMHQTKFPHTEIMHAFKGLTLHKQLPKSSSVDDFFQCCGSAHNHTGALRRFPLKNATTNR